MEGRRSSHFTGSSESVFHWDHCRRQMNGYSGLLAVAAAAAAAAAAFAAAEKEYTIIADIRASAVKDQTVQVTTSSKTMRSVCSEKRDYAYTAGSWSPSCAFWEPIPIFRPCLSTCSTLALATIRGINLQGSAPLQGGGRFSSSDEVADPKRTLKTHRTHSSTVPKTVLCIGGSFIQFFSDIS
ncbi:hypothetical protein AXG93_3036s1120 [Marchantia polymorpha subsp. ruderalis]|uniref:Uncharacterized protein n=1 Tax=Marchantia polymorpha subsp. ruderalis TaxID=1480154 RepID=A0A176W996_MARPO|nr:hypothetical protein AXG93_3036s1120 [Marchantia polymorpha subsp. ruderalis]